MRGPQIPLEQLQAALAQAQAIQVEQQNYKAVRYYPDCQPGCNPLSRDPKDHVSPVHGRPPLCRALYWKSLQFWEAGLTHRERLFLAANRIGKTDTAAFEMRCHLTGLYPKWWNGKKFDHPVDTWAAGDTMLTTRDILQLALLGKWENLDLCLKGQMPWTGMIDSHRIVTEKVTRRSGGVDDCVETIVVEHEERVHGARSFSTLGFRSYDQGRRIFQGTEKHIIWLDEEPPGNQEKAETRASGSSDIYTECLMRTMTVDGMIISTFTPLNGMTQFLIEYLAVAVMPNSAGVTVDAKSNFYPEQLGTAAAIAEANAQG